MRMQKKAEMLFITYVENHAYDYSHIVSFICSKHSTFNAQSSNSHKLILKKLNLIDQLTQNKDHFIGLG